MFDAVLVFVPIAIAVVAAMIVVGRVVYRSVTAPPLHGRDRSARRRARR